MGFAAVSAYEGCCHEVRDGFEPIVLTKKQRNALITDVILVILVGVTVFLAALAARGVNLSAFNALSRLPVLGRALLGTIACGLVVFDFLLLMIITCAHVSKLHALKEKMQTELTTNAASKLRDSQEISKLKNDLSDAQKKVPASGVSTEDHEALKQALAQTQQERDSYRQNFELAKKEMTDEDKRKLFEDNGTLQQELRFAKNSEEVLKGQISQLERELNSKQALALKIEELQQQVDLLNAQKTGLETEISGKKQQVSNLEQDIAARTLEIKNLQESNRQTKETLENEIQDLGAKKTQLDTEKKDLEGSINKLNNEKVQLENEIQDLRAKKTLLEKEKSDLDESKHQLNEDIKFCNESLKRLNNEKAQVELDIKKLDEAAEAHTKKIETIKAASTPETMPKAEKTVEAEVKKEKTEHVETSEAPKIEEKLESAPAPKETKLEAAKSENAKVSKEIVNQLLSYKMGEVVYDLSKFAIIKMEDSKRAEFLKNTDKDVKYFIQHVVDIVHLADNLKENKSENQTSDLESLNSKCLDLAAYIDQIAKIEGVELSKLFA